jgi:LuxR family maltose regulon positive regulatory protein
MRARLHVAAGDLESAEGWAADAGVTVDDAPDHLPEYEHLTLVRLLLAQHRAAQHRAPPDAAGGTSPLSAALALLDRLDVAATRLGRHGSLREIRLLQALAHHALGDVRQAVADLGRSLADTPEPGGCVRLDLDEGPAKLALLHDAAGGPEPTGGQVREQVDRLLGRARAPDTDGQHAQSLFDTLSPRELQVLGLLDSERSGPEIARELYVTVNTLRTHTKRIFTKLDVTSRAAAVRRARELGLV